MTKVVGAMSRKVLVVDDDDIIREVAKLALEVVGGWQVDTATNGVDAGRAAARDTPDVVLLDGQPSARVACGDLKRRALAAGRKPESLKVFVTVAAERLEPGFDSNGCDGLNFALPADLPSLEDFADRVLPELRRRSLAQSAHAGATLRRHLGLGARGGQ
mgnify:CR=1 FL=1